MILVVVDAIPWVYPTPTPHRTMTMWRGAGKGMGLAVGTPSETLTDFYPVKWINKPWAYKEKHACKSLRTPRTAIRQCLCR